MDHATSRTTHESPIEKDSQDRTDDYRDAAAKGEVDSKRREHAEAVIEAVRAENVEAALERLELLEADVRPAVDLDVEELVKGNLDDARGEIARLEANRPLVRTPIPEQPDSPAWLVADWLPVGRVSFLSAPGGAGKSRLALQLSAAIAAGPDEHGSGIAFLDPPGNNHAQGGLLTARGGNVVYGTWEDDAHAVGWRLKRLLQAGADLWPGGEQRIRERLHLLDLAAGGPVWSPRSGGHTSTLAELTPLGAKVRSYAERVDAALLVLDPLAAAYAANENDRGLVRQFMANWDAWARKTECAVLLISHPAKATAGEGSVYSGSTDWRNAARAVWQLCFKPAPGADPKKASKSSQEAHPCLILDKSSYGQLPRPRWLVAEGTVWHETEEPAPATEGSARVVR